MHNGEEGLEDEHRLSLFWEPFLRIELSYARVCRSEFDRERNE